MTIKELAEKCSCSVSWVYAVARRLGRTPTEEEMNNLRGRKGRPPKYREEEERKCEKK